MNHYLKSIFEIILHYIENEFDTTFRQTKKNTFSSITKLGYDLEINFLSEVVIFRPNFMRSNYFP